jgi:hypothetical protein
MLPEPITISVEPFNYDLSSTGVLSNVIFYMFPFLAFSLWKSVIWFFIGTDLLKYAEDRLDTLWLLWLYNLNFPKLFFLFFAIFYILNLSGLCLVWGLEYIGLGIDHTDYPISFSANPGASGSVGGTEGTPVEGSSSQSSSPSASTPTSTQSPGTQTPTHSHTGYGSRADAAAQAAGNSAIMATSLAAGFNIAKNLPTVQGKVGAVLTSIVAGGSAIATKNLAPAYASNITQDIGKRDDSSKLVSIPTWEDLNTMLMLAFNFTDDYLSNFLLLISISHKLQWFCATMIGYYAILLYVPIEKLETFYHRLLPNWLAGKIIKSVRIFKKTGVFLFVIFYGLLIFSMYIGDINLNMILEHYEDLCQYHINKTK